MGNPQHAKQFTKLSVEYRKPRAGFDAYIAVWSSGGDEVVIGAPTLDALAQAWESITARKLERERAQHVVMTYCDVPEELLAQAKEAAASGRTAELRREPTSPPSER